MRGDVAGHHEPGMAALAVMPILLVKTCRVVAEIDVVHPGLLSRRIEARRPRDGGITAISEFLKRALTAIRAVDPHGFTSVQVGLRTHALLVDHPACAETVEPVSSGVWVRLILGDEMGKTPARSRRRLEAAIAPAGVEIEAVDRGFVDNGRAVHGHVEQAAPRAQDAQAPDQRHERHAPLAHIFDDRQIPTLGVGIVALDVAAEHEPALIRLTDIEMTRAEGHHHVDQGLHALGDEGLHRVTLDRKAEACERCNARGIASAGQRYFLRRDVALLRLDPEYAPLADAEAGRSTILDDVNAARVG